MNTVGMPGMTALFGGNWNNASNAGTFNWNLNNATSNVNSNIGTRVTYFANHNDFSGIPCLLAKHNNEKPRAGRIPQGSRTLGELYKEPPIMKRYGHLYSKIYDMDNLIAAHHNARKGKSFYREVQMVDADPEKYLGQIQEMLRNKTYRTSRYKTFMKIDKGKEREIFALPYYPDRIIQWAVVQVLEPIWMKTLIADTFSSLKGRGIHQGLRKLQKDLQQRQETKYCLKLDVKKFYPSIDHAILKIIIRHKIKDRDVLALLDNVIDSAEGVPIGNYLSQYFGNLYLSAFDHWMKEVNRVRYYYRYCDDIVVLGPDKPTLRELLGKIGEFFRARLNLKVKENWQVFPTFVRGVDFLGYRCFGHFTLLRKSTVKLMKKKLTRMLIHEKLTPHDLHVIGSYYGWVMWCDGNRLRKKYIDPLMRKEILRA